MKRMRKTGILIATAFIFAAGSEAHAVSFSAQDLADWSSLNGAIEHPSGSFGTEGAVDGTSEGLEYIWDLGGSFSSAFVVVSTDHVASNTDRYSFNVAGFDGSSWISGTFGNKAYKVSDTGSDSDDFALRFKFSSAVSRIGVNSNGSMALSDSSISDSRAEFDGVSRVPEPSTFMLMGSALAGLAFFRRKTKA